MPGPDDIESIIQDYAYGFNIPITLEDINELCVSFKGLSDFEIRQILNLAYQRSGLITAADKQLILDEKEQIIKKTGILEILSFNSNLNDIGGLDNLKRYLHNKSHIFNNLGEGSSI